MTTIPSFSIIIDAFNNKKSVDIITLHEENEGHTSDILISNSAPAFRLKLKNFVNNWLKVY